MTAENARRRLTATDKVEEYIRHAIYRGALKPRERVIEEAVAKQLNCSRGPVREAFLRLERDGLAPRPDVVPPFGTDGRRKGVRVDSSLTSDRAVSQIRAR